MSRASGRARKDDSSTAMNRRLCMPSPVDSIGSVAISPI